jgi:hypothetical protein
LGLPTDPTENTGNEIVSGKEARNMNTVFCSNNRQAVGGLGPHQFVVQYRNRSCLKEMRNIITSAGPHFFFQENSGQAKKRLLCFKPV